MGKVVAKLFVSSLKRQVSAPDTVEITLSAVSKGDINKSWAEATPSAKFEMTIQNPVAAAEFSLNQEFLVTFEPAGPLVGLADGHPYTPGTYEKERNDNLPHYRCMLCNCKRPSHDEPLRSKLVKLMGGA